MLAMGPKMLQIPVRRKPDQEAKLYDTKIEQGLRGLPAVGSVPLTAYGGRTDRRRKATDERTYEIVNWLDQEEKGENR